MVRTADIRKTLTDRKPLYPVAGAGEFAVEKLREVPARLAALRGELKVGPQAVRGRVTERIGHLPGEVRALPGKAQELARGGLGKADEAYDDLADRGKTVVDRVRRQQSRKELVEQTERALRGGRGTRATARKGAARTTGAGKAPVKGAKKTAEASAEKIGD
jgi:heparin binding hemagglutinin HbhA